MMSLLWLRVALIFYGVGLAYALLALSRRGEWLARIVAPCIGLGFAFHLVSIVEDAASAGHLLGSVHRSESLLAFLILAVFLLFYSGYRTLAPGMFVFPMVFVLALTAALGQDPPQFSSPLLRSGWIVLHVALVFAGYGALFFSFAASVIYILQERSLKSKRPLGILERLPSLDTMDKLGYRSLVLGFPFMTLGLIAGAVIAQVRFGPTYFQDPKIVLSVLMWVVYIVLLYSRWQAGWRGRRAAYLVSVIFVVALGAWAANYFSGVHRFIAP